MSIVQIQCETYVSFALGQLQRGLWNFESHAIPIRSYMPLISGNLNFPKV
jgi:hypothetical protein